MYSSSKEAREYKGAVALNNMAIALAERRCYRQALDTFRDAVSLMKGLFRSQGQERLDVDVDFKIHNAAQRLSRPHPERSIPGTSPKLCVVSYNETHALVLDQIIRHAGTSDVVFMIRIEPLDFDASKETEPDLESSILLHNFGNAYRLLSTTVESSETTELLRSDAFRLFHLSHSVLSTQTTLTEDEFQLSRILLTAMIVLQSLIGVSNDLGLEVEASEYQSRLFYLQTALSNFQGIIEMGEQVIAAAAA